MENEYPENPDYIHELLQSEDRAAVIEIDNDGRWLHNNEPFTNERIIKFFNRSLDRTRDGEIVVSYNGYVYPVRVADVAVFVTGVRTEGFGDYERIYLTLTTGEEELLDPFSLSFKKNNCLYCLVRNGRMMARFKRSPSFRILERLQETDDIYFVRICGKRIVLKEKME